MNEWYNPIGPVRGNVGWRMRVHLRTTTTQRTQNRELLQATMAKMEGQVGKVSETRIAKEIKNGPLEEKIRRGQGPEWAVAPREEEGGERGGGGGQVIVVVVGGGGEKEEILLFKAQQKKVPFQHR